MKINLNLNEEEHLLLNNIILYMVDYIATEDFSDKDRECFNNIADKLCNPIQGGY